MTSSEHIAIIGMGCRFPGANGPDELWRLVSEGRTETRDIPPDRWNVDELYAAGGIAAGKMCAGRGGFIAAPFDFDAEFFGISPREATWMDPQQRILLEVSWEALEDAGQSKQSVAETNTGVFVGATANDYGFLLAHPDVVRDLDHAYLGTGISLNVLAGRLSYCLGLEGPSVTLDTACSSSLVAVHLACQSLRSGESSMAIAAGVHLILAPVWSVAVSQMSALSPDGECKTLDASADGYGRSEGVGVVVLKRLKDAIADGDPVRAVIRGSTVNQDGKSNGLTAPSGKAQERLLRKTLVGAGVDTDQVTYIELHGTGTVLGDPIEVDAIRKVYDVARKHPLYLGALKTNIGHLEGAAGVAGLIKVALCLEHAWVPPLARFGKLNPHIDLKGSSVTLPLEGLPWQNQGQPRLAGISAFGWSGTNAHVLLENGGARPAEAEHPSTASQLLTLSAQTPEALLERCAEFGTFLTSITEFGDVCYTTNVRRTHFRHRVAVCASNANEAASLLRGFLDGESPVEVFQGVTPRRKRDVVFVFGGQGTQWQGMGAGLLKSDEHFRSAVKAFSDAFEEFSSWSIYDKLCSDAAEELESTDVAQPAIVAIQIGIDALLREWGVRPSAVVGHSLGEVTAAFRAGVLSLREAARIVWHRSRLMARAPRGKMFQISACLDDVRELIGADASGVSIAAFNGLEQVVVSGTVEGVLEVASQARARGFGTHELPVSDAFHSALMTPIVEQLERALVDLEVGEMHLPLVSTVTGVLVEEGSLLGPRHWARGVREPVQFFQAVSTLKARSNPLFVEIGPSPVLQSALASVVGPKNRASIVGTLRRGKGDRACMLRAIGNLHTQGIDVDFTKFGARRRVVSLPRYPWRHQTFRSEQARWRGELAPNPTATRDAQDEVARPEPFRLEWTSLQAPSTRSPRGTWLIFDEGQQTGLELAQRMGGLARRVCVADDFAATSFGFNINPTDPSQFRRVLEEMERATEPLEGIVYLWGAAPAAATPDSNWRHHAALLLIQALDALRAKNPPRVWFVTRNVHLIEAGGPRQDVGALLCGVARCVRLEIPSIWGGLIDLSKHESSTDAAQIEVEILSDSPEDQVVWRGAQRHAARLRLYHPDIGGQGLRCDGSKTYAVFGGLGSLGCHVASWLVDKGARTVVLVGRTAPTDFAISRIRQLQERGALVKTMTADVSDSEAVTRVFDRISAELPPVRGIVQAAGVLDDGVLSTLDLAKFDRVVAPKVSGSWNLHLATKDLDLDFFCMFSSAASVLGSVGQANYAAANAYLGYLARYRKSLGLAGLAVAWGLWSGSSMMQTLNPLALTKWKQQGIHAMPVEDALARLEQALLSGEPDLTVMAADWQAYSNYHSPGAGRPNSLLIELVDSDASGPKEVKNRLDLTGMDPQRRGQALRELIGLELAKILDLPKDRQVDWSQGFFEMGMDSLMAVELRNRLQVFLGLSLSSNAILNFSTVSKLSEHVTSLIGGSQAAINVVAHTSDTIDADTAEDLDAKDLVKMSHEDLIASLDSEADALLGDGISNARES